MLRLSIEPVGLNDRYSRCEANKGALLNLRLLTSPGPADKTNNFAPNEFRGVVNSSGLVVYKGSTQEMPTTPSITCGLSYGTSSSLRCHLISSSGPNACQKSKTPTSDKNSFASSRTWQESSPKMSSVARGSSTSTINCQTVK